MLLLNTYKLVELSVTLHNIARILSRTFKINSTFRFVRSIDLTKSLLKIYLNRSRHGKLVHDLYSKILKDLREFPIENVLCNLLTYDIYDEISEPPLDRERQYIAVDPHMFSYLHNAGLNVKYGIDILLQKLSYPILRNRTAKVAILHPCHVRNNIMLERYVSLVENILERSGMEIVHDIFVDNSASCCGSFSWLMNYKLFSRVSQKCISRIINDRKVGIIVTYCPFCYINIRHLSSYMRCLDNVEILDIHEMLSLSNVERYQ